MFGRNRYVLPFILVFVLSCSEKLTTHRTLTILLPDDILSIEPNREFETITDTVLFNVYEPLVGFDKDMHLVPMLAETWENPKPDEWRFHLRKNVKFHDGTTLVSSLARDILLRIQSDTHLEASTFLEQIKEIQTVDDHTLTIKTKTPYAFLTKLPFVYLSKPNNEKKFPPMVGTGAFTLHERKEGTSITLRAWNEFWGSKPLFDEVFYVPVYDSIERFQKLIAGQADIVYQIPPQISQQQNREIRLISRPGLAVLYLGLNMRQLPDNPTKDPKVRRAIHLALDRQHIVDKVLLGNGTVSTQPVAPSVFGFNPDIGYTARDLSQASRLLKDAGYANGFKVRLDFSTSRISTAQMVQQQLRPIGITVELNGMHGQGLSDTVKSGMSQMFLIGWDCSSGDASEFYEFCLHTPLDGYGVGNYGGYSNTEIDGIARSNMMIVDQKERKELLQRAARVVMEDLPVLPLYIEDDIYGMKKGIHFEPRADHEIKLIDVKFVKQ